MTPRRRYDIGIALSAVLLFIAGCATGNKAQRSDPPVETYRTMWHMIATAGNEVTMQWDSRPGATYGVYYSRNRLDRSSYRPLSGYSRIVGVGGLQTLKFTAPAAGQVYYRLLDYDPQERQTRSRSSTIK